MLGKVYCSLLSKDIALQRQVIRYEVVCNERDALRVFFSSDLLLFIFFFVFFGLIFVSWFKHLNEEFVQTGAIKLHKN
jgi:hypothetical protein